MAAPGSRQLDRDGTVLKQLPPIWGGLTASGVTPPVRQAQTAHLPNAPFAIDDRNGLKLPLSVPTRDLWHQVYQQQMQINGGRNDRFVAYGDSGALVMGHYDGAKRQASKSDGPRQVAVRPSRLARCACSHLRTTD